MCRARDRLWSALVVVLVEIILVVAGVCLWSESSTVEVVPSVQGVAEPR